MKTKTLMLVIMGVFLLAPTYQAEAQFLKKLGKKAEEAAQRGVERSVERKASRKAEKGTDKAIESVFGVPKKAVKKKKKNKNNNGGTEFEGTWYYEKMEGVPGFESLNDCGKKSNISFSGNTYHTKFYDNDCKLLIDGGGIYKREGNIITVTAKSDDGVSSTKMTTVQTILKQSKNKMVIRDEMTGAVLTLEKR